MYYKESIERILAVLITVLVTAVALIAGCINYLFGYIGGIVIKLIVGDRIISCLNTAFGISRLTPEMIPVFCGIIAYIGAAFTNTASGKSKKDE